MADFDGKLQNFAKCPGIDSQCTKKSRILDVLKLYMMFN